MLQYRYFLNKTKFLHLNKIHFSTKSYPTMNCKKIYKIDMKEFWRQENVKNILQLQRDYFSKYSPMWNEIKPLYDEMGITEQIKIKNDSKK